MGCYLCLDLLYLGPNILDLPGFPLNTCVSQRAQLQGTGDCVLQQFSLQVLVHISALSEALLLFCKSADTPDHVASVGPTPHPHDVYCHSHSIVISLSFFMENNKKTVPQCPDYISSIPAQFSKQPYLFFNIQQKFYFDTMFSLLFVYFLINVVGGTSAKCRVFQNKKSDKSSWTQNRNTVLEKAQCFCSSIFKMII